MKVHVHWTLKWVSFGYYPEYCTTILFIPSLSLSLMMQSSAYHQPRISVIMMTQYYLILL